MNLLFLYLFSALIQPSMTVEDIFFGKLEDLSKSGQIALHFPCVESNMFSTNCACHIKCGNDPKCMKAINVCKKYQRSHLCKYVLLRGGRLNKFATLKRMPTTEEKRALSILDFSSNNKLSSTNVQKPSLLFKDYLKSSEVSTSYKNLKKQIVIQHGVNLCPNIDTSKDDSDKFLEDGITLTALSYKTPLTLANSMRSWNSSSFLDLITHRTAILNQPTVEETPSAFIIILFEVYLLTKIIAFVQINMSKYFGFEVIEPSKLPNSQMIKPNVFTIGAAFFYALNFSTTEYVIFLENDFKIDTSLSRETIMKELLTAAMMLKRGAEIVRLLSRKSQGCGTFKDCSHGGIHLDASDPRERLRNWFSFYCRDHPGTSEIVNDCTDWEEGQVPAYRCFTSWDSNWSLNAVMVKKSTMISKKYLTRRGLMSIADIALSHSNKQDGFETDMAYESKWMTWKVPVCLSYNGLFLHEEIETAA